MAKAIRKTVDVILAGIDECEIDSPEGWWETSKGAEFGAAKKQELIKALEQLWQKQ